jgi:pectinesterase
MEQIYISDSNITIENKTFSASYYAKEDMPDGTKRGTFRSYTVLVDGDNVCFKNCVFENTAGRGQDVGQAIALYVDGDGITLENCVLRGHQDTLFLAPLPDKEIIPGGFTGPKQFTERKRRTVYFKNCVIEGGVDFIFGGATAYFDSCEFVSVEEGYVFAPSTPKDVEVGFVARNCTFTASDGVEKGSCYIARPWRNHAYVKLENCYLGEHIHPLGFDDWGKMDAHATVRFFETGSFGPGASVERPEYVNKQ